MLIHRMLRYRSTFPLEIKINASEYPNFYFPYSFHSHKPRTAHVYDEIETTSLMEFGWSIILERTPSLINEQNDTCACIIFFHIGI